MKTISSVISLFVVFFTLNAQDLTCIDLTKAEFGNRNAEEIFNNFEIVPLETHEKRTNVDEFYLTDKYIIGMNFLGPAYLFDRKTGVFIHEISSYGKGDDQYAGPLYNKYGLDEKNNILFAHNGVGPVGKSWKCINIETNKVESIFNKPLPENNNETFHTKAPWLIKDSIYVAFCNNTTGKEKTKLIVFDENGTLIKKYPNHLEYNKIKNRIPFNYGIFYYYNSQTYFKEPVFNDTVFSVNEKEMLPHIVFKSGDRQPSYYHQESAEHNKNKYFINFVYESDSIVMFNFSFHTEILDAAYSSKEFNKDVRIFSLGTRTLETVDSKELKKGTEHTGYYDKKSKQVFISSSPDLKKSGGYTISGIPVSFYPVSINKNNEMIAKIDPAELIKYKDTISSKYQYILKNIQEGDNPVIIIAKLKE
jgi:hypothetical protein